jgi:hypothetical protein
MVKSIQKQKVCTTFTWRPHLQEFRIQNFHGDSIVQRLSSLKILGGIGECLFEVLGKEEVFGSIAYSFICLKKEEQ